MGAWHSGRLLFLADNTRYLTWQARQRTLTMVGGRGRGQRSDTLTHTLGSAPPHLTWPRGGGGGQPGGDDHCIFPSRGEAKGTVTSLATHADVHLARFSVSVLPVFLSAPGHIASCSLLISPCSVLPALCVPLVARQSGLRSKYFPIGFHVIPSHTPLV